MQKQQKQQQQLTLFVTALVIAVVASLSTAWAHEAGWPGKRLSEVFPKAENFKARQVTLSPAQIARIEKLSGSKVDVEEKAPIFYIAYGKDGKTGQAGPIGAVVFIDAVGERGNMEINVAVSLKGRLHSVSLWKHKESKAIERKAFLKQFNEKKKLTDPFKVGEDIVPAEGAEKASQALATAAKKGWLMFQEVFGKKKANMGHMEVGSDHHEDDGHLHDRDARDPHEDEGHGHDDDGGHGHEDSHDH